MEDSLFPNVCLGYTVCFQAFLKGQMGHDAEDTWNNSANSASFDFNAAGWVGSAVDQIGTTEGRVFHPFHADHFLIQNALTCCFSTQRIKYIYFLCKLL